VPTSRPRSGVALAAKCGSDGRAVEARARRAHPSHPGRRPPLTGGDDRRRTQRRLGLFLVVVLGLTAAVTARLVDLQVVSPSRYVRYGIDQRSGFRVLAASRGALLDRSGQPFALSVGEPQVVIDPSQVPSGERAATIAQLARTLSLKPGAVAQKLAAGNRYQVIAPKATGAQVQTLKKLALPGVGFDDRYVRTTPSGPLAASVVGRALPDGSRDQQGHQGLSGIERQYDAILHGESGTLRYERDPRGHTIPGGRQQIDAAKPGTDLYLTLDQTLQYETEQSLLDQVNATRAQGAIAVIMRPSTGEILSMASVARGDHGVTVTKANQAVTDVFEPGSVNKVITMSGAIEQGLVTPDSVQQVPDHLQIADRTFSDDTSHPIRNWTTTDILVTSSNIGTIGIASRLGKANFDRYLQAFGFGQPSGLDFPGESGGILRPLKKWSTVDMGAMPIGQGISVTALQMLLAYNVIANNGRFVAPKLVAATDRGSGRTPTTASATHQVVSSNTATAVRAMLDKVVTDGTGTRAAVPGYVVAGKTGTARIPQSGASGSDGYKDAAGQYHYQSSFVGMVDGADLSIIVSLRDAQTSIFGGDVAAPLFARLAASALRRFHIAPPSLATAAAVAVPDLSATARKGNEGDVTGGTRPAAG
jgi:cell division protein FtsI (penicillin-binding protein 3)